MTIGVTNYQETNLLIKPSPRTFYPTMIKPQHYQLKNFISTTNQGIIYFASNHEVYSLHISSRKRRRIASLPWIPCCLGAGYGWVCLGGWEHGRCAFIDLGSHGGDASNERVPPYTEVDALLPLDLDPESRLAHDFLHGVSPFPRVLPRTVEYHELGTSIVNSITVHCLKSGEKGLKDEVVAVLTNNDCMVRIYSLTQSRILQKLEFPTAMNHATICPDGKLLIASGDEPKAFFCRRKRLVNSTDIESNFARFEWQKIADPRLSVAIDGDPCFSTGFSPSGHICAIASQIGTITIFDTRLIKDEMATDEAVIDVLKSSRPCLNENSGGAVRSMSFSPEPWDLFAWAEDYGRVCVTDLRSAFRSRQTIELDLYAVDVDRVDITDYDEQLTTAEQRELEIEARFVQRHREALDAQDRLAAVTHAADYMELAAERRRLQRAARDSGSSMSIHDPLAHVITNEEAQVLESLRVERLRDNEREQERRDASTRSFSIQYHQPSDSSPSSRHRDNEHRNSSSSTHPATRNTSIHQYVRERYLNQNRPTDRSYQPRRRGSVIISNSTSPNPSFLFHPSSLAPIGSTSSTLSTSPSRLGTTLTLATSTTTASPTNLPRPTSTNTDPWQTTSAAISSPSVLDTIAHARRQRESSNQAPDTPSNFQRRIQQQQQQSLARTERSRAERLRQLTGESSYDEYELEMLRMVSERMPSWRDRGLGVGIMGIGWSPDGRFLYVGTEEGIIEYAVNIQDRKTFPNSSFT